MDHWPQPLRKILQHHFRPPSQNISLEEEFPSRRPRWQSGASNLKSLEDEVGDGKHDCTQTELNQQPLRYRLGIHSRLRPCNRGGIAITRFSAQHPQLCLLHHKITLANALRFRSLSKFADSTCSLITCSPSYCHFMSPLHFIQSFPTHSFLLVKLAIFNRNLANEYDCNVHT
jgi:hypothetical protein